MTSGPKIIERKHRIGKEAQSFECDVEKLTQELAILKHTWHRTTPYMDGPAYLPAETIITRAFFWIDRSYVVYKLSSPAGKLYGDRIDSAEAISITENLIEWRDLVLDFWISPDGVFSVLDEDELQEAIQNKLITDSQVNTVRATESLLKQTFKKLILELEEC
jgi:predicted RNA-binding protein associated with RNAse of E/G family